MSGGVVTVPSYQRVVDGIREQVLSGALRPGDRLPTYAQLAAHYKTTATAVARGMSILRALGVVTGYQGKGVYVSLGPDL